MRTTLLSTALPNEDSGSGASITLALIAAALRERGHEVSIAPIVYPEYETPDGADYRAQLDRARSLGYDLEPVVSAAWQPRQPATGAARVRRLWRPPAEELYPTLRDAGATAEAVARLAPDAVLVYGFEALAASRSVAASRFAATSDPPHLSLRGRTLRRWREERRPLRIAREAATLQSTLRAYPRLTVELLRECEAVGAFGRHHADWLRELGLDCGYYRTPIADPGPSPVEAPAGERPRLLLIGHLQGTATRDGLRVFAGMLPLLERELGPAGFEARIVGGYDPPPELAPLLDHPAVRLVGFVDDVAAEFRGADVLLVPVSIRLGVRVRVLTGFSYGCCIVTHSANAAGIPELEHGRNALLADTPEGLGREVLRVLGDPELRARLRSGARETYERWFTPAAAGGALGETLERIATGRR